MKTETTIRANYRDSQHDEKRIRVQSIPTSSSPLVIEKVMYVPPSFDHEQNLLKHKQLLPCFPRYRTSGRGVEWKSRSHPKIAVVVLANNEHSKYVVAFFIEILFQISVREFKVR
jgi:hypothetical protein